MCYVGHELTRHGAQSSTALSHRKVLRGISHFSNENLWKTMETDSLKTGISLNYGVLGWRSG